MQEYLLGNLFGLSQVLIGHPFDTLKTNLQNSKDIKIFFKKPLYLYRGISYPLLMNSFSTSILFGNYDYFLNKTDNKLLSGILTGSISSTILTPFDYKKIQLQTLPYMKNTPHTQSKINGLNGLNILNTVKQYYTGFTYTLTREIIAIPIYFYTYHYLNELTNPFIAGGFAGVSSWLSSYPFDTLKTRKQLNQTYTVKELYKIGNLYKGLPITLVRAFIVNGSSFYLYDFIKKNIKTDNLDKQ
jgi:solute carrier family 25 carnitine/acylcarnitine transporter 20/29